jgi:hypothetical protein
MKLGPALAIPLPRVAHQAEVSAARLATAEQQNLAVQRGERARLPVRRGRHGVVHRIAPLGAVPDPGPPHFAIAAGDDEGSVERADVRAQSRLRRRPGRDAPRRPVPQPGLGRVAHAAEQHARRRGLWGRDAARVGAASGLRSTVPTCPSRAAACRPQGHGRNGEQRQNRERSVGGRGRQHAQGKYCDVEHSAPPPHRPLGATLQGDERRTPSASGVAPWVVLGRDGYFGELLDALDREASRA